MSHLIESWYTVLLLIPLSRSHMRDSRIYTQFHYRDYRLPRVIDCLVQDHTYVHTQTLDSRLILQHTPVVPNAVSDLGNMHTLVIDTRLLLYLLRTSLPPSRMHSWDYSHDLVPELDEQSTL